MRKLENNTQPIFRTVTKYNIFTQWQIKGKLIPPNYHSTLHAKNIRAVFVNVQINRRKKQGRKGNVAIFFGNTVFCSGKNGRPCLLIALVSYEKLPYLLCSIC